MLAVHFFSYTCIWPDEWSKTCLFWAGSCLKNCMGSAWWMIMVSSQWTRNYSMVLKIWRARVQPSPPFPHTIPPQPLCTHLVVSDSMKSSRYQLSESNVPSRSTIYAKWGSLSLFKLLFLFKNSLFGGFVGSSSACHYFCNRKSLA